jgi:Skp family chaperone for outer membrane proteins
MERRIEMSKNLYSDGPVPASGQVTIPVMAAINVEDMQKKVQAIEAALKNIQDEYKKAQTEYQTVLVQLDQAKATVKETLQIAYEAEKNIKDLVNSFQSAFKAELDKLPGFIKRIYGVK